MDQNRLHFYFATESPLMPQQVFPPVCWWLVIIFIYTRPDLFRPDVGRRVREQQDRQKTQHDSHSHERGFVLGQKMWVCHLCEDPCWIPGAIVGIQGSVSYQVQVAGGAVWCWHVDHIWDGKQCPLSTPAENQESDSQDLEDSFTLPDNLSRSAVVNSRPVQQSVSLDRRYPSRIYRPSDCYGQRNYEGRRCGVLNSVILTIFLCMFLCMYCTCY